MRRSRLVCILAILLVFISYGSFADSVEDEFAQCASFVLRDEVSAQTVYRVDLSYLESSTVPKSVALKDKAERMTFVELEMELANAATGEKIGDVRCYLTDTGQLVGAEFVKIYPAVASN